MNQIDKLNFLIGNWNLEYEVFESRYSSTDKGKGQGTIKKILNNKFVIFDYSVILTTKKVSAKGIFAWDQNKNGFHYWWFEDTGNFMEASCQLITESSLHMEWSNSSLVQTIIKSNDRRMALKLNNLSNGNIPIMKVIFALK